MIYTLGCSFTKWYWPTWSDWLGTYQGPVTNWAHPGYGNQLIHWVLLDRLDKLTPNDHVYIMWSENTRVPQWYDSEWIDRNKCEEFFPQRKLWFSKDDAYLGLYRTHPDYQFSLSHMIIDTFRTILETQQLLNSVGVKYTMMFMCNPWQDVRPIYKPTFSLQWPEKMEFSSKDQQNADKLLKLNPIVNLLGLIDWTKFVENIDIFDPQSYTGLWEYYFSKKEFVLAKHNTDPHPNVLVHHDYLLEKILRQNPHKGTLRNKAKQLATELVDMSIPIWNTGNFIGSPETQFLDKEKYGL